jgi:hypothetical protein
VRYELNSYILFRRNSIFKGLKATTLKFAFENPFSILQTSLEIQTEHEAQTSALSGNSSTWQGKKEFPPPPVVITQKSNDFIVLKDLNQVIATSTTCAKQGIRFHFSSEQDYKVALNYFKFYEKESYTYQTAERKIHNGLLRWLPVTMRQKQCSTN